LRLEHHSDPANDEALVMKDRESDVAQKAHSAFAAQHDAPVSSGRSSLNH
jgi:hypothetical protein